MIASFQIGDLSQNSLAGCILRPKARKGAAGRQCRAPCRGVSSNGAAATSTGAAEAVEMYVAEDLDSLVGGDHEAAEPRKRLRVPPPRKATPRALVSQKSESQGLQGSSSEAEVEALKAELGVMAAELREASVELAELKKTRRDLRSREGEVTLLKAALVGRDINLRNSKAELISAQEALREKDAELQAAYQRLMAGAQERGRLRGELTGVNDELVESRSELETWIQNDSPEEKESLKANSAARREGDVVELMGDLARLRQQVAEDASQDEEIFNL